MYIPVVFKVLDAFYIISLVLFYLSFRTIIDTTNS